MSDSDPSQPFRIADVSATARMAALKRYNILDTERDAVFDGIVQLATALLEAPIAVVNFIAEDRQWFKAEIGIGQRELPLDVSICRIALPERGILVVPDLAIDNRFDCNPLVTAVDGMRFYAGMVLESDGVPIGTVCVLDTRPRPDGINEVQRRGLETLGIQAMAALERSATGARDRFRLALTERLRDEGDTAAMMEATTEALGRYLGVGQVGFAEVEVDQVHCQVHRHWTDGRVPPVVGRWRMDDFGPEFIRELKAGRNTVIPDVTLDARTNSPAALERFASIATRAMLNIGLFRDGRMQAVLFLQHHEPRPWTKDDVTIVEETLERLWAAVARARAKERLQQSEALFRTLTDTLPALIFIADADGANIYSNSQFSTYTGFDGGALLGDGWIEALHPDDRDRAAQTWARSWRDGKPYETNYRFRSATGDYRTFLVRGSPVCDGHGNIVQWVGQCTDIDEAVAMRDDLAAAKTALIAANAELESEVTARTAELVRANRSLKAEIRRSELAQNALIQGQKLEALGQLTAGVAHDFNNILAAVASGMDLIAKRTEDEQTKFITGHCRDAAFRGATLVKQMLAFARQEVLAPRSVYLSRLADDIAPLINQAIPGNIVSIDFSADLPPVLIDPVLLETTLLNLAVNARDAMPGGGMLSLTARVSRPGDRHHPAQFKAVEAVVIEVRDSGEGMPPEIVQRVTEPFFTTKAPGSGTGLGLAMVHGFIGQSGGAMHIDSRVGMGTTISLFLPLNTATTDVEPEAAVTSDAVPTAGVGALLLVDDDAAVRTIASIQLRDLGYSVVEADGLVAAMTLIESGEPFDAVVTDVVMPGGDGIALAAAIRSIRPGLPIMFMTGRADGKRVAGEQVLHKPFKLTELAAAVADIIGLSDRERATVAKIASRSRSQCIADMLEHWSAGKFAGKIPGFAAFDADVCSEPHKLAVVMADSSQLPMRFQVVSAGKDLEDLLGRPMSGTEFDVRGTDGFGSAEESYRRAVKTRLPVFDYMKMDFGDGGPERFERLIMPYSSDGGMVDRLVSVVVFTDNEQKEE